MKKKEVIDKLSQLITAGFGLAVALAWNDALKSLFEEGGALHFLADKGPWVYAATVTVLAVLATVWIGRAAQRASDEAESNAGS